MYVACVPLRCEGRRIKAGERVPGVEKWRECVIRAHLNLGWMKKEDETPAKELVEGADSKDGAASVNPPKKKKSTSKKKTAKKAQANVAKVEPDPAPVLEETPLVSEI